MKKSPSVTQSLVYDFDKPAKQRIVDASDKLYRMAGIWVGMPAIAKEAHSNTETAIKFFGYGDELVCRFVRSLIEECQNYWKEAETEHPHDPEAQLRFWLFYEQERMTDGMRPEVLLSRTAVELRWPIDKGLLAEVAQYWQAERRRVVKLCQAAGLREPLELADKLLLLVQGARNERGAYGRLSPSPIAFPGRRRSDGRARSLPQARDRLGARDLIGDGKGR